MYKGKKFRAAATNFHDIYSYSRDHEEHMIRPHTAHLSFAASSCGPDHVYLHERHELKNLVNSQPAADCRPSGFILIVDCKK